MIYIVVDISRLEILEVLSFLYVSQASALFCLAVSSSLDALSFSIFSISSQYYSHSNMYFILVFMRLHETTYWCGHSAVPPTLLFLFVSSRAKKGEAAVRRNDHTSIFV